MDMLYFNCGHSSVKPGHLKDNNNNDNNSNHFVLALNKKKEATKDEARYRRQVYGPAQMPNRSPTPQLLAKAQAQPPALPLAREAMRKGESFVFPNFFYICYRNRV